MAYVSRFLNLDRNTWRRLKADPTHFPSGIDRSIAIQYAAVGEVRSRQRKTRDRISAAPEIPSVQEEDPEVHWRVTAAVQMLNALGLDSSAADPSPLYAAYFEPTSMAPDDFAMFFRTEVNGDELPRHRIAGLVDFLQRRRKVTAGNWMDQGHALELLNVDLFFTRDGTFHKIIDELTTLVRVRAQAHLLDDSAPTFEQLETVLRRS